MKKRGGGSIINIASISSFIAQPAFVPYNTTKGIFHSLSLHLRSHTTKLEQNKSNCVVSLNFFGICEGAVLQMTRCMAMDLGPSWIRVNAGRILLLSFLFDCIFL
jgi:NAD(P)-dependent dehydrogenase (short-subunit alcohol dehydrogenase family)